MAASSPALSNNSTDINPTPIPTTSAATNLPTTNASKNLRGLNKPKCIKCGNVARSRCPYQSCKSCCAKAQNPCHIHVLKSNSTFPDKASSSGSPLFDQQSTEASPSSSNRVVSIRQLSNNFAQFNNFHTPLRSRKPLTRKDAAIINEWRFSKLKEYKDRYIEAENDAFDHYMQNVTSLEEVFSVNSTLEGPTKNGSPKSSPKPTLAEGSTKHGSPISNPNPTSAEDSSEKMNSGMKLKFRSNQIRTEIFRKRIQCIVDQGLKKLRKIESNDGVSDLNESDELVKKPKKAKSLRAESAVVLSDLIDKLNKARNEEDLKSCLEMKDQLFNRHHMETCQVESEDIETSEQKDSLPKRQSNYSPPKWFSTTTIDQEALNCIDAHFSSLEEIEDL